MEQIPSLVTVFNGESFDVVLDPSVSFDSATEIYDEFSQQLLRHKWRQIFDETHIFRLHLLNFGAIPNSLAVRAVQVHLDKYQGIRLPTFQELLAFDRQYPDKQFKYVILAPGVGALGLCGEKQVVCSSQEAWGRIVQPWNEIVRSGVGTNARFAVVEKSAIEQSEETFSKYIQTLRAQAVTQ